MIKLLPIFFFALVSTNVHAEVNSGDTAWILSSSALVLFMTLPGLALFYAGLVQSKNVLSVLCQHFGIACLMSIIWVVIGYSIAFSPGESGIVGNFFENVYRITTWGLKQEHSRGPIRNVSNDILYHNPCVSYWFLC